MKINYKQVFWDIYNLIILDKDTILKVANNKDSTVHALLIVIICGMLPGSFKLNIFQMIVAPIMITFLFLLLISVIFIIYRITGSRIQYIQFFRVIGYVFIINWLLIIGPFFGFFSLWILVILYRTAETIDDTARIMNKPAIFIIGILSIIYHAFNYGLMFPEKTKAYKPAVNSESLQASQLPADIPCYNNAVIKDQHVIGNKGRVSFKSPDPKDKIFNFYVNELMGRWYIKTKKNSPYGNYAVITAVKAPRSLDIRIEQNYDKTSVITVDFE